MNQGVQNDGDEKSVSLVDPIDNLQSYTNKTTYEDRAHRAVATGYNLIRSYKLLAEILSREARIKKTFNVALMPLMTVLVFVIGFQNIQGVTIVLGVMTIASLFIELYSIVRADDRRLSVSIEIPIKVEKYLDSLVSNLSKINGIEHTYDLSESADFGDILNAIEGINSVENECFRGQNWIPDWIAIHAQQYAMSKADVVCGICYNPLSDNDIPCSIREAKVLAKSINRSKIKGEYCYQCGQLRIKKDELPKK
ncbi:MAG: hypothetical protein PHU69_12945 [Fermentimonas sp.]|nr:hypothetical protein [Fermentimonas sp.]